MASLFNTPGAIHHYLRFRGSSAFVYLGTAQVAPVIEGEHSYIPVFNDRKSRTVPQQKIYDGSRHVVTTDLNRLDLAVWRRLRDCQTHDNTVANQGIDSILELGTLTIGSGDVELALVHDLYGTPAASADLSPGRLYYSATVGNFREDTSGTRVLSVAIRFDCDSVFSPTLGTFSLFTEYFSGLTFPTPT